MALTNKNEAYDISLFESTAPQIDREREKKKNNVLKIPNEKLQKKARKRVTAMRTVQVCVIGLIIATFVGFIIQGQVRLTELNQQITNATATLDEQESLYTQVQMKVESKLSSTVVEEYAQKELGMSRADSYQKNYISLSQADKAEVSQAESSNIFESIAGAFANLWS